MPFVRKLPNQSKSWNAPPNARGVSVLARSGNNREKYRAIFEFDPILDFRHSSPSSFPHDLSDFRWLLGHRDGG